MIKKILIKNEKGFTTVEILVAMLILALVFVASFQFFETYENKTSQFGEYETAKFLAINGIENERAQIIKGDMNTGVVYTNESYTNLVRFQTTVEKESVTPTFAFFDSRVGIFKLTSIVTWKGKKMEVSTYVSTR